MTSVKYFNFITFSVDKVDQYLIVLELDISFNSKEGVILSNFELNFE